MPYDTPHSCHCRVCIVQQQEHLWTTVITGYRQGVQQSGINTSYVYCHLHMFYLL